MPTDTWGPNGIGGSGIYAYPDGYVPAWSDTVRRFVPAPNGSGSSSVSTLYMPVVIGGLVVTSGNVLVAVAWEPPA